jgi:hypothetical protein
VRKDEEELENHLPKFEGKVEETGSSMDLL